MKPTHQYPTYVETLSTALTAAGARFTPLDPDTDEIGGIACYDERGDLIYDVLVVRDDQSPATGRYFLRQIDGHPQHVPCFELRTDDVDGIVSALRARRLLPSMT